MQTKKLVTARFFTLALGLAALPGLGHADFVVVVNSKSSVTALTAEQAAQIFLGKVATFPTGEQAIPVDIAEGVAIRNDFYETLTKKNPKQLLAYRANMVFSGKGQPPKEMPSSKDVKRAVTDNLNVVGYIEKSLADDSVRVVYAHN